MSTESPVILGEYTRTLDDRFRISLPPELTETLLAESPKLILAKERLGCLSLWGEAVWEKRVNNRIKMAKDKLAAGMHENELGSVQMLGRLLSTRHEHVELAGRGRLLIPKGFRDFLGVDPNEANGECLIIGAALCVEIWQPQAWLRYLRKRMPQFRRLVEHLA